MTEFQIEVAKLFFSLPTSQGFLLAGGGALAAQALTQRSTEDLDFFGGPDRGGVATARDGFEAAARGRGWTVDRLRDEPTFCRLAIAGPDVLTVDLAIDSPASLPPMVSFVGPTFDPEELGGRKVLALFDRAEARDFTDVYELAQRYGKGVLLARAAEVDLGFHLKFFAQRLRTLGRVPDVELPIAESEKTKLRVFFAEWADELSG